MMARLSLHARLILIALVTGAAALLFAGYAIGTVLEGVVRRNLHEKLDAQIGMLARATDGQGVFHLEQAVILPGFERNDRGWGWDVTSKAGRWTGGTRWAEAEIRKPDERRRHPGDGRRGGERTDHGDFHRLNEPPRGQLFWGRAESRNGEKLFLRRRDIILPAGLVSITASGPRDLVDRPLRAAMMPLLGSLGLLALGLGVAALVQLRFGLKPVRALRDSVAQVRQGERDRLPEDIPQELRPLAAEVNGLIAQNTAGLDNARSHVANLAHGLKTPLATLALRLAREGASAESQMLVAQMDKRIAHHLRRARMAAAGSGERARTDMASVADELVLAMTHIHAARSLDITQAVTAPCDTGVERQDGEEMLGNLLDNACRHAAARVRVSAQERGALVALLVEDDGPGIAEADRPRALDPGTRLDESGTGYGFGLGIVRELAELYGGGLSLDTSDTLGGLCATLTLPRRR